MGKVIITEANGQLGIRSTNKDGVVGVVGSGVAVAGKFALGDVLELYSKEGAEAYGITEAYDADNSVGLYALVKEFYNEAGAGAKLLLMPVATSVTLAQMVDKDLSYAATLMELTKGEPRIIGITKSGATGTTEKGFDDDAFAAIAKAKALRSELFNQHRPPSFIIEGKGYGGNLGALEDLRAADGSNANRVSVYLGQGEAGGDSANIGLLLGRLASISVQANPGRVKDGELNIDYDIKLSDGTNVKDMSLTDLEAINDKGYIVPRYYDTEPGYYFFDAPTACPVTDDYAWIYRGRVMDKAHRLVDGVFVKEINDDMDVDADSGQIPPAEVKYLQRQAEKAIETNMMQGSRKEISAVELLLDPAQNVLSTDRIISKLRIMPKGMKKFFDIEIGYDNPFNS